MSIEKFGRVYIPTCDICGAELYEVDDFYSAVEDKKAEGWKSRNISGEWVDVCVECQQEGN